MWPGETSCPLWLASFPVEGCCAHGLGAGMGGRVSRHCPWSAERLWACQLRRGPFVIHKVQMPNSE